MVIKKTINKEAIKEMPKVLFPGQIHMVQTPWEAGKVQRDRHDHDAHGRPHG